MLRALQRTLYPTTRLPSIAVNYGNRHQSTDNNGGAPLGVPTKMMASEAFVETLVAQGVTDVMGIVGSAFMDALDLFPEAGIRFVSVQHEQNAGHMADGYARASGKHGVCIAQNGPGKKTNVYIFYLMLENSI